MKPRTYLAGVLAVCATIVVSAGLLAQENPYGEMSPEQQAAMQAWMEYASPGEHHELLAKRVGEWTVEGEMWETPDGEAQPFTGTSTIKSVMGGRFLLEKVEGPGMMPGMPPFEGRSVMGYDNLTKTYFTIWFDNMSTGVARYEGTPSGDGKMIHYDVEVPDLMAGRYKTVRAIDEKIDNDHGVLTMYNTTADGDEFKAMVIKSTRAGAEPTSKPEKKRKY